MTGRTNGRALDAEPHCPGRTPVQGATCPPIHLDQNHRGTPSPGAPVPPSAATTPPAKATRQLKRALFLSAFASLKDPACRAYYDRKRGEGKRHNQALIALARRRCDTLYAHAQRRNPLQAKDSRGRLNVGLCVDDLHAVVMENFPGIVSAQFAASHSQQATSAPAAGSSVRPRDCDLVWTGKLRCLAPGALPRFCHRATVRRPRIGTSTLKIDAGCPCGADPEGVLLEGRDC
jgi:hypothetical protein